MSPLTITNLDILTKSQLAQRIEHTLLKPEATPLQVDKLCQEAIACGFAAVCVNPVYAQQAARALAGHSRQTAICAVVGFPLGASRSEIKAAEARKALDDGATEIDMVLPLGLLIAGDHIAVRADIEALAHVVHQSAAGRILKVILETGALTEPQIIQGCRCAMEGEADFVKTSTGFHPSGGATVEHVRLLHRYASPMLVKASGGIRNLAQAKAMLQAGAARLGTSSGPAILQELESRGL